MTQNNGEREGWLHVQVTKLCNKAWVNRLWIWIGMPIGWWQRYRNVFDLVMVLSIASLLFAVFAFIQNEAENRQIIDSLKIVVENEQDILYTLKAIVKDQRKNLEKLRVEGRLPPGLAPQLVKGSGRPGEGLASIEADYVQGTDPLQFIIRGSIDIVSKNRSWWIGTHSGLQVWPQIELSHDIGAGEKFEYRLTVPCGVESGSLVLVEAGPVSRKLFADHTLSPVQYVGLYWPHLVDVSVLWSVVFP